MKTGYFILKTDGWYSLKDLASKPIKVSNQEVLENALMENKPHTNRPFLVEGEIYPLECEVEIKESRLPCNCISKGSDFEEHHLQYCDSNVKRTIAFVKLKEETKEVTREQYKEITGFDTKEELSAYDKGREHEQATIIRFIKSWKGNVSSEMGELLNCKLMEVLKKQEVGTKEEDQNTVWKDVWDKVHQFKPGGAVQTIRELKQLFTVKRK